MRKITFFAFFALLTCMHSGTYRQLVLLTLAGTGAAGFRGDRGAGYLAHITGANDVCRDVHGNLYIADEYNARIRKLSAADGTITTVGGGGMSTSDGVLATSALLVNPHYICVDGSGNLYISCGEAHQVKK